MKALQKFCYSKNCDIAGFVGTAGRLCYKVHFAWLLHSLSFYWIFLNKVLFSHKEFLVRGVLLFLSISSFK